MPRQAVTGKDNPAKQRQGIQRLRNSENEVSWKQKGKENKTRAVNLKSTEKPYKERYIKGLYVCTRVCVCSYGILWKGDDITQGLGKLKSWEF